MFLAFERAVTLVMATYICSRCNKGWGLKCSTVFVPPSNDGWMDVATTREAYRKFTKYKSFYYTELSDKDSLLLAYETRDELKEASEK